MLDVIQLIKNSKFKEYSFVLDIDEKFSLVKFKSTNVISTIMSLLKTNSAENELKSLKTTINY